MILLLSNTLASGQTTNKHVQLPLVLPEISLLNPYMKKMKETEKDLRLCHRNLENMKHTLAAEDRPKIEEVEKQVEKLTEEVLESMFAPPKKESK